VSRFFFHVLSNRWFWDDKGEVLPDASAALAKAQEIGCELLQDLDERWIHALIGIEDEDGKAVATVVLADLEPPPWSRALAG
jgi:hypothetical protein